ncbi:MAG TPA: response regulator transcription factor [Cyclobacteriaceae bacterium]|nr:response regulator transcription factor [Cyclobacteriaceae bacterium]
MNKATCMIVEDEPVSQELLRRYISELPQLDLVSVCSNAIDAGSELRKQKVDLLFLDINMPRLSGTEFYSTLVNPPAVIFTTAYPEFAVAGFELNAVDYLVKPFPFERFVKAVGKFLDQRQPGEQTPSYIALQADKKTHKVNFSDIDHIEAMGDYAKVKMKDKTLVVHQTLQKLGDQLPAEQFRRIHKSFIISMNRLEYVEGNMAIVAGQKIPIGQTYRGEFMDRLSK